MRMENNGDFKWWHVVLGMVAAAVLTASFAPSPSTSDEWIHCSDFRENVDIKYEGDLYDYKDGSTIYFEPVGGFKNSSGDNFLLSMENVNVTRDVPFTFTETIWAKCEDGELKLSNFYWPGKEGEAQ